MSTKAKRQLRKKAPERRTISTGLKLDRQEEAKRKNMIKQSKEKRGKGKGKGREEEEDDDE